MKKIFIAYATDNMAYSLYLIGQQARRLGLFDDVICWTPKDLPDYILDSPLMKYSYGGGFWAWKPCKDTKKVRLFVMLMQVVP